MPTVEFRGERIECEHGAVLRDVLREADLDVHNGRAAALNCRGHGTCGTCAVEVDGETSSPSSRERLRLSAPPHDADSGLRLACQTRVEGDLVVTKHPGLWGQHVEDAPE
ncbi:MAG: 2Fe-2S iron-sulfur cluster-binding protein [Haloferacaceae archaeon]